MVARTKKTRVMTRPCFDSPRLGGIGGTSKELRAKRRTRQVPGGLQGRTGPFGNPDKDQGIRGRPATRSAYGNRPFSFSVKDPRPLSIGLGRQVGRGWRSGAVVPILAARPSTLIPRSQALLGN